MEEVQIYTHLNSLLASLIDTCELFDDTTQRILGYITSVYEDDPLCQFHPEKIVVSNKTKTQTEKRTLTNVAPVETTDTSIDEYLSEIDSLRRQLNQKEAECKQYKSQYAAANAAKKEAEGLLKKYENNRNELIALREFAYKLEQEIPEIKQVSIDEMKKNVIGRSFVIIGGHINWINKLKSEFPDWTYIQPSAYKTLDANGLENKERIFFFTDYLSHITYTKFVAIAREKKIPFSYLHGVNMEQIIRRIYESVG